MHDQATARALLHAAEDIAAADGPDAVSVRRVADAAGVSVRAVYSLYGSKDGMLAALGTHAFNLLGEAVRSLPVTDDPAADLVEAAVKVFRRFVLEHPSLFRIGVQNVGTTPELVARFVPAAAAALTQLRTRVARLAATTLIDATADTTADGAIDMATMQFHALCEGLAAVELRCLLPQGAEEIAWRSAVTALVAGFCRDGGPVSPHRLSPLRDAHRDVTRSKPYSKSS